jgi:hypothetical protein
MSARTRSVSAVIRLVSAPPVLRIDVVGPDPRRPSCSGPQPAGPGPPPARSSSIPESSGKPHPRTMSCLTPSHWDSSARSSPPIARGAL